MTTVQVRWNQELVEKSVEVNEYSNSMDGVDVTDQNSVYYRFIHKTGKWWRKLFFWLLEVTVNNYVLYQAHASCLNIRPLAHLQFRRKLGLATYHVQAAPTCPLPGWPRKRHHSPTRRGH